LFISGLGTISGKKEKDDLIKDVKQRFAMKRRGKGKRGGTAPRTRAYPRFYKTWEKRGVGGERRTLGPY